LNKQQNDIDAEKAGMKKERKSLDAKIKQLQQLKKE